MRVAVPVDERVLHVAGQHTWKGWNVLTENQHLPPAGDKSRAAVDVCFCTVSSGGAQRG